MNYALRFEVAGHKVIDSPSLKALKAFVLVLSKVSDQRALSYFLYIVYQTFQQNMFGEKVSVGFVSGLVLWVGKWGWCPRWWLRWNDVVGMG